jgi:hypothetical protein
LLPAVVTVVLAAETDGSFVTVDAATSVLRSISNSESLAEGLITAAAAAVTCSDSALPVALVCAPKARIPVIRMAIRSITSAVFFISFTCP